jgi:serine/threonine-protein kinase
MRRNTPLITLLTGAALGVVLLIASMLSTPSKAPAGYSAAATTSPGSSAAARPSQTSATPAQTPVQTSAKPSPASAPAVVTAPAKADYAGRVQGGGASVAISIHDGQAIAYVCNGSAIEAWYKGTAVNGVLIMTGKNHAHLSAIYDFGKVTGDVLAHGTDYSFAVGVVHKPSGLYQATALVRGVTVKAGWIVLPNNTKVGALEPDADSPAPSATRAPDLDVATGTAQDGDVVLHATLVSGATGRGF